MKIKLLPSAFSNVYKWVEKIYPLIHTLMSFAPKPVLPQHEEAELILVKPEYSLKTEADIKGLIESREFRSTRKTVEYYKAFATNITRP